MKTPAIAMEQLSLFSPLACESGIDQDEIDRCILGGSGFENGKKRIVEFFAKEKELGERARFLCGEYGVGGWSPCFRKEKWEDEISLDHDSKGISLHRRSDWENPILLSWNKVAEIIGRLIESGDYKGND